MFQRKIMTGSQIEISGLFPGIRKLTDPYFNPTGVNAKSFGKGIEPQIVFRADSANADYIYLAEHDASSPDQFIWLRPGDTLSFDYNVYAKAMNIFYATGTVADLLFVICR